MCPAEGMWEPRSTLTQCLIVPLSLLVTEGAVLKPEHRKRDSWKKDCRSDVSSSRPCRSAHRGVTFYGHL